MKLFIFLCVFSVQSFASTDNNLWQDSGLIKTDEKSAFGLELKMSPLFTGAAIATVTYTKNNQEPKNKIINLLKKSVPAQKWAYQKINSLDIYETYANQNGNIYRLAFNNKTNDFSLATIPVRYLLPTYFEVQKIQAKHLKTKNNSKYTLFIELFIKEAVAQTINIPGLDLTGVAGALNNGLPAIASAVNTGLPALANAANNGTAALNNIADTARNISADAKDLVSAPNIARMAAITGTVFGFTSSLSSMLTNFIVSGSIKVLRNFYYEAIGEFKPEEKEMRLKRFENAFHTLNDLSPKINELSSKMAALSVEVTLASGVTQEQFLSHINDQLEKARKAKTEASADCTDCMSQAALKVDQLQNLKNIVIAAGAQSKQDLATACKKTDELYKSWVQAEYSMLNSKRLILQDMMLFNGQLVSGTQSDTAYFEERKQKNSCKTNSEKIINEIKNKIDTSICEKTPIDMTNQLCRSYFAHTNILKNCDELAKIQPTASAVADLDEATLSLSSSMTEFSKNLAAVSCETNSSSCSRDQMQTIRQEFSESFKSTAKSCPSHYFSKEITKNRK